MPFFKEKVNLNISFYCGKWVFTGIYLKNSYITDFSKEALQRNHYFFFFFFLVIAHSQNNDYELQGRKTFLNSTIRLKAEKLERVNTSHPLSFKFSYLSLPLWYM